MNSSHDPKLFKKECHCHDTDLCAKLCEAAGISIAAEFIMMLTTIIILLSDKLDLQQRMVSVISRTL